MYEARKRLGKAERALPISLNDALGRGAFGGEARRLEFRDR